MTDPLEPFRARPDRAAVLLDFDGSLSEIVTRAGEATAVPGAREAVQALAARFLLVAVISGRPTDVVAELVGAQGVRYEGLYGLGETLPVPDALRRAAEEAAASVPGAWAEDKGATVSVHYREAADVDRARREIAAALEPTASASGYEVIEGKMVLEAVPAGAPRKGGAVERLIRESGAAAVLYAGDDLADLEAFQALDRLGQRGIATAKVAVRGSETPEALLDAADLVVDGPSALVELLHSLDER